MKLFSAGGLDAFFTQLFACPVPFFCRSCQPTLHGFYSHAFCMGAWAHILGNMWFLFIFGEQRRRQHGAHSSIFSSIPLGRRSGRRAAVISVREAMFRCWAPRGRSPAFSRRLCCLISRRANPHGGMDSYFLKVHRDPGFLQWLVGCFSLLVSHSSA